VSGLVVRDATLADIPYVDGLRRRESGTLGFLPLAAYEKIVTQTQHHGDRLWIAVAAGDPVGFLYASPGRVGAAVRVIQVCTQPDARRREYAAALMARAERMADRLQRPAVSARVGADLEARAFWDALGYAIVALEPGGARRRRLLEVRMRPRPGALMGTAPAPPLAAGSRW
jgi:GNAT superfamily N-acetyltransferase